MVPSERRVRNEDTVKNCAEVRKYPHVLIKPAESAKEQLTKKLGCESAYPKKFFKRLFVEWPTSQLERNSETGALSTSITI